MLSSYAECDLESLKSLINDFAEYTYNLHKSGIVHYDYNLSNILFHEEDGKYKFTVLDINRVVFGRIYNREQRLKGLNGLGFPLPLLGFFIERYTQLAGLNSELFFGALLLKKGIHLTNRIKSVYKAFIKWVKSLFPIS